MILSLLVLTAAAAAPQPGSMFSEAERTAILRAAGAERIEGRWSLCPQDHFKAPAAVENPGDLDGDGRPEAVVTQGGSFCYGHSEVGFALVSKQADGRWKAVPGAAGAGIPRFLPTRGRGGWPDIEIGGPGFCFPVWRFDGGEYAFHRASEQEPGGCAGR